MPGAFLWLSVYRKSTENIFEETKEISYICPRNQLYLQDMKTREEYLAILRNHAEELKTRFGIRSLRLFGSVARGEHQEGSDVDVCVEMAPSLYQLVSLKQWLEALLACSVDVIRMNQNMNSFLKSEIDKDGIYVIS